jgi:uncharacterized repeat protein (TIGR01451 family)
MGSLSSPSDTIGGEPTLKQVTIQVTPINPVDLINTASVTGSLLDPYQANNTAQVRTFVGQADLTINKYGPAIIDANQPMTYTIVVTNNGPSEAPGVQIVDDLPANLTGVSASPSLTCQPTGATQYTCGPYTVPIGGVVTATITGVSPDENLIVNQARTFHDFPDLYEPDNSVVITTSTTLIADLELIKFADNDYNPGGGEGLAGEQVRYIVQIGSLGPSPASGLIITDTLPPGVEFASVTPEPECQYIDTDHQVVCDMGGLVLGPTLNVRINVTPTLPGIITNTATVTGTELDPNITNNTDDAVLTIVPADLEIEKLATRTVLVSDTITYTLVVSSIGPSNAHLVVVTDTLPSGVTTPTSIVASQGSCDGSGNPVICTIDQLDAGATAVFTFTVLATEEGVAVNEAATRALDTVEIDVAQASTNVQPVTDLAIGKVASGVFYAGEPLSYTLTITNIGPSEGRLVRITDTLPSETNFQSATTAAGNCSENGGEVTCTIDSIPRGGSHSILIGTIAGLEGDYVNSAFVGGDAFDPDLTNNSTTITTTILPAADLGIVKSDSGDFFAGESFTYTLDVTNAGPSAAESVVITDSLPAGVVFQTVQPPVANCVYNGGAHQVVCLPGNLVNGASTQVTIKVTANISGYYENVAETASATTDLYPADNTDSVTTYVRPVADLALTKGNVTLETVAGQQHTYAITVTNNGPSPASNVTVTDTLPAEMSYVASTAACVDGGALVSCDLGSLGIGASISFQITVDVDPSVTHNTVLVNQATASATEADLNLGDNTDTVDTLIIRRADLELVKVDDGSPAIAGETHPYTITVNNLGPSDASSIVVADTLPALTSYDSASVPCSEAAGTVTCNLPNIAAGGSFSFILFLELDPSLAHGATIINGAEVAAAEEDLDTDNNRDTESTRVDRSVDLRLDKTDDGSPAVVGEEYTYTLLVTNDGPSDGSGVSIDDKLPNDTSYVSGTAPCIGSGTDVVCDLGDLPAGASSTVTITMLIQATADHGSIIVNSALVTGDEDDPVEANNADTESTLVLGKADLGITKTDFGATAIAGGQFVYEITIDNAGPSEATGIVVTDTLPGPMTYAGSTDSCAPSGGDVVCSPVSLASGASTSFLITVTVAASAPNSMTVTNNVAVGAAQVDRDPANDTASDTSFIVRRTDLQIRKEDAGVNAVAGLPYEYTLTATNNGLSDASGVIVTDTLPLNTSNLASSNGICADTAGNLTCTIGNLPAGQTSVFTVSIYVEPSVAQSASLFNAAGIYGNEVDPNLDNNRDTTNTTVDRSADVGVSKRDSGINAVIGEDYSYSIDVFNNGPSNASGVILTDTLPVSTTFVSASLGCVNGAGTVVCTVGDLVDGASDSFTITINLDDTIPHGAFIDNTVDVEQIESDPNIGNNSASVSTEVTGRSDLALSKTDNDVTAIAGEQFTYELEVTNNGPTDSSGVEIADTLPAEMSYFDASVVCSPAGQLVTCQVPDISSGFSSTVFLTVTVAAGTAHTTTVTNLAVVSGDQVDPIGGNNSASDNTVIAREADLEIAKSGEATAVAGENYVYTIDVDNNGLSDASGVTVTDTLPSGASFISATGNICAPAGQALTCILPDLAAGGSFSFDINVSVAADLADGLTLLNKAGVFASEDDPAPANNTTQLLTTVDREVDLILSKQDDGLAATVGEPYTYTIWVTNTGPSYASGVSVLDTLPGSTSYADSSIGCAENGPGTQVTCNIGDLVVNQAVSFTLQLDVDPDLLHGILITNEATVSSNEFERVPADNTDSATTTVQREIDISISKSDDGSDAIAGGFYTYTMSVTNDGPSNGSNVVVTDTLPAHSTFEWSTAACAPSGADYICTLGNLNNGVTSVFSITVSFASTTTHSTLVTNTVQVAAAESDLDPGNDFDDESTTVVRETDLVATKSDSGSNAVAGAIYDYTVTVQNDGLSDATGVVVTDTLPSFTVLDSAPAGCVDFGAYVRCPIGDLLAGDGPVDLDFAFLVNEAAPHGTTITNTANVGGSEYDPDLANNQAEETTIIDREADLKIEKSDLGQTPVVGEPFTYVITVTNNGPSLASNVVVTDSLPADVTFVGPVSCNETGGEVTCDLATPINSGDSVSIQLDVAIGAGIAHGTIITNTAGVEAAEFDPDLGDNKAEVGSVVLGNANLSITKVGQGLTAVTGTVYTYTVTVENLGPSNATGITVVDTLPANTSLAGSTDGCAGSGQTYTCDLGALDTGNSTSFDIGVLVDSSVADDATMTNNVSVSADQADLVPGNNTAEETTTVNRLVNLSLDKRDDNSPATAGEQYTFTIDVTNDGPSDASNVIVTDILPAGTTYASSTIACAGGPNGPLSCGPGNLVSGGGGSFDITVNVSASVAHDTVITNTASVASNEVDGDPLDDQDQEQVTVVRDADLSIVKSDNGGPAIAGQNHTYTVTVSNNGPSDAGNVVFTDTLPSSTTLVGPLPAGCSEPSVGTVRCDLANMDDGVATVRQLTINLDQSIGHLATISNNVEVSSDDPDGNSGNNDFELQTQTIRVTDLGVTKRDSGIDAVAGQNYSYTIDVTNNGPASATGITIQDTLPVSTTFVSPNGQCTANNGVVSCDMADLASGDNDSVILTVFVQPSVSHGQLITNTVAVSGNVSDNTPDNDTANVTTTVVRETDLAISKSDDGQPAVAGGQYTYDISVDNLGDSDASGVVVTDTLPASTSYGGATGASCLSISASQVRCTIGELASGGTFDFSIDVTVDSSVVDGTVITNNVLVAGNENESALGNNSDQETTAVERLADLSVTKSDNGTTAVAGKTLTYTITLVNNGLSDATGIVFTDTLPAQTGFVSAGVACTPVAGGQRCDVGDLTNGASTAITFTVDLDEDIVAGTVITNTVLVDGTEVDPNGSNNTATEESTVTRIADLALVKAGSLANAVAGGGYTYTVTVTNNGPSRATGISVSDDLPAETSFVSSTGGCTDAGGTLTCTSIPDLAVGASDQFQIVVDIDSDVADGGTITNEATVSGNESDDVSGNDTDSVDTIVGRLADLEITKSDDNSDAAAGDSYQYTVVARNNGPSDASGVVFTDTLPVSTTLSSPVAGCVEGGGELVCNVGVLAEGTQQNFIITIDVDAAVVSGTVINNIVEIDGNEIDPDAENNDDNETTTVLREADLAISKSASASTMYAGETLTYTLIVSNNGPSLAEGVTVVDDLPSGFDATSATTPDGSCDIVSETVTCIMVDMAPGSSSTITVVGAPLTTGVNTNSATVSGQVIGLVPGNDSDSANTSVTPAADVRVRDVPGVYEVPGPNQLFTVTLQVDNFGPSTAVSVVLTETLLLSDQDRWEYVRANYSCGRNGTETQVVCDLGNLASGASFTVDIVMRFIHPVIPQVVELEAEIKATTHDLDTDNNIDDTAFILYG